MAARLEYVLRSPSFRECMAASGYNVIVTINLPSKKKMYLARHGKVYAVAWLEHRILRTLILEKNIINDIEACITG